MRRPKITIITPSLNQSIYLEQTILSVINQNYDNFEYIIIDGGSRDGSSEIINRYEKHISFWCSENDAGQANAINKGLSKATGEIINWLNSDDILLPNALATIASYYDRSDSTGILYGDFGIMDQNGEKLFFRRSPPYSFLSLLYGRQLSNQPSVFLTKNIINNIGYLNESYQMCMDQEYWVRAAVHGFNFIPINRPLSVSRVHKKSKTYNYQNILDDEHKKICRKYGRSPFPDNSLAEDIYCILMNRFWRSYSSFTRTLYRKDFTFLKVSLAYKRARKSENMLDRKLF